MKRDVEVKCPNCRKQIEVTFDSEFPREGGQLGNRGDYILAGRHCWNCGMEYAVLFGTRVVSRLLSFTPESIRWVIAKQFGAKYGKARIGGVSMWDDCVWDAPCILDPFQYTRVGVGALSADKIADAKKFHNGGLFGGAGPRIPSPVTLVSVDDGTVMEVTVDQQSHGGGMGGGRVAQPPTHGIKAELCTLYPLDDGPHRRIEFEYDGPLQLCQGDRVTLFHDQHYPHGTLVDLTSVTYVTYTSSRGARAFVLAREVFVSEGKRP